VETDLSLFLEACPARLSAVSGSKGKSGVASALHWALNGARKAGLLPGGAFLGGNITLSPLTFLDELTGEDDVVLELSSWQLGDLRGRVNARGEALLKPRTAVLTAIMADHLDRYGTMEAYVKDKRTLYAGQDPSGATIALDDLWGRSFLAESPGRPLPCFDSVLPVGVNGGWLGETQGGLAGFVRTGNGEAAEAVPAALLVPGKHQKKNLLEAALALCDLGLPPSFVRESLGAFPGIEHRLEFFAELEGIRFYNDTAATIPEAAAAGVEALAEDPALAPPVLVVGGADKNLDFTPLAAAAAKAAAVFLLAGTGSGKILSLLRAGGINCPGEPFDNIEAAAEAALEAARTLRREGALPVPVLLSPGCASFGMFLNEFDRGRKWKEAVLKLTGYRTPPGG
jgi:UDP-N-acetylmuramoylalanine--D-glutamate ligase